MKNIKNILLAALLLLPINVYAGGNMIGTGVIATGVGVTNIYYQRQLGDTSAVQLGYVTLSNVSVTGGTVSASSYSVSYKGYFSEYADGGFWQLGASSIDVTGVSGSTSLSLGSAILPILIVGYDASLGPLVIGGEVGLGTNQGWGVFSLNAAFKF